MGRLQTSQGVLGRRAGDTNLHIIHVSINAFQPGGPMTPQAVETGGSHPKGMGCCLGQAGYLSEGVEQLYWVSLLALGAFFPFWFCISLLVVSII